MRYNIQEHTIALISTCLMIKKSERNTESDYWTEGDRVRKIARESQREKEID